MFLHCFCSSQGSPPIWQHAVWNARGSTASFVTAVSNLPDLPALHFPSLSEGLRPLLPLSGYINELHAEPFRGTADQVYLKTPAVLEADAACCTVIASQRTWSSKAHSSRADLGCFKGHVLALCYPQLLIHLSAHCSETLLSQKMSVLLVTRWVDTALAGNQLYLWPLATYASTSHNGLEAAYRGTSPLENSHTNLQCQIWGFSELLYNSNTVRVWKHLEMLEFRSSFYPPFLKPCY